MPPKNMWQPIAVRSAGLTIATTAYTSGDVLGTEMQFNLGEVAGKQTAGIIGQALITDASDGLGAVDLFLFSAVSTPAVDNAANSWADADWRKLIGIIPATVVTDSANNKAVFWMPNNDGLVYALPTDILYVVPVTRTGNAIFGAATDMEVTLWVRSERG